MSQIRIIPLFSGSSGNCTYVCADGINLLFDIGKNCKQTLIAMEKAGIDPSIIDGVFITHSHGDHIAGVDVFIRKYPSKLYGTRQTLNYINRRCSKPHVDTPDICVTSGETIVLSDTVEIIPLDTPHDAAGSVCYKVIAGDKSAMIMTDLGFVTDNLISFIKGVDGALIESNYDERMLVYGSYPDELKARIAGRGGHISNDECAVLIENMINSGARKFILAHLSEENNTPRKAHDTVDCYLRSKSFDPMNDYHLDVASRHEPSEGFEL